MRAKRNTGIIHFFIQFGCAVFFLVTPSKAVFSQDLKINEVMYVNSGCLADGFGEHPAWIELYNNSGQSVQLSNYYLSVNEAAPLMWHFPSMTIAPGDFALVFASGRDVASPEFHTNFKLRNAIDPVLLYDSNVELVDQFQAGCVPVNRSVGRLPDGFADIELLSEPSPESTNNIAYADFYDLAEAGISASLPSGFYIDEQLVTLQAESGLEIRYTMNSGEIPTWYSNEYHGAILVSNRSQDENRISLITTTAIADDTPIPDGPIDKSNVLRAVAMQDGCPVSPVITRNYFITAAGRGRHPVHVLSVNTDTDALFNSKIGIYVPGERENFIQRGREWERPAAIELIDPQGEITWAQDAGIRIHGSGTRQGAQKSLRLYARGSYGTSWFNYPLFEDRVLDRYKRLIMRTAHGDWTRTLFKDDLCHYIVRNLNIHYQSTLPVVAFLNGEYWGIHNLRERQDTDYLESHFGVDGDQVDVLDYDLFAQTVLVSEGDDFTYNEFIYFLQNNDLSIDENYEAVAAQMDIPNTIDHYISHLFFANTDFPYNNNSLWREKTNAGVWRWLFFDCDGCMIRANNNHLFENLDADYNLHNNPEWSMIIFRSLLRNSEFASQFAARFQHLINTTFSAGNVIASINRFEEIYSPLVSEHIHRWDYPHSFDKWKKDVQNLRSFAMERPRVMSARLEQYFGQPFAVAPNPSDGRFQIQFFAGSQVGIVGLYDALGRHIEGRNYLQSDVNTISFDRQLPVGVYLLRVESRGRYYTQRIVVAERR